MSSKSKNSNESFEADLESKANHEHTEEELKDSRKRKSSEENEATEECVKKMRGESSGESLAARDEDFFHEVYSVEVAEEVRVVQEVLLLQDTLEAQEQEMWDEEAANNIEIFKQQQLYKQSETFAVRDDSYDSRSEYTYESVPNTQTSSDTSLGKA